MAENGDLLNARMPAGVHVELQPQDWSFSIKQDVGGWTPLTLAAFTGHDTVVEQLLPLGVTDKDAALYWACYGVQSSTVALLLDAGASFNALHGYLMQTLLIIVLMGAAWSVESCCQPGVVRRWT